MNKLVIMHNQLIYNMYADLNKTISNRNLNAKTLRPYMHEETTFAVSKPFEEHTGIQNHLKQFWQSILQSFPDLQICPTIILGDRYKDMDCVCCAGYFLGRFQKNWLGITANQQSTWIRYHAHFIIEEKKIVQCWYYLDVIGVMQQSGLKPIPQKGVAYLNYIPMSQDGLVFYETDDKESQRSLQLVNNMLEGLLEYDGQSLKSMAQERFWDVNNMMWYGPAGIGTSRGLIGFQQNHQIPFLQAFPDRGILPRDEMPYSAQLAQGNYVCDFGFPSMYATHNGDGWLGLQATGKKITMRVVDIWRREGKKLVENWVMIDILDILEQLGENVLKKYD